MTILTAVYDEVQEEIVATVRIPKKQTGEYTYGDGTWTEDNVCVYIDNRMCDYTLNHLIYLDYKDSLQVGAPILHFDSKELALKFAEDFHLQIHEVARPDWHTKMPL